MNDHDHLDPPLDPPHDHDHLDTPRWILLMPHDHDHLTMMYIDPPSGWMYGFPKEAPANLREMNDDQLNEWLVSNGYPQEEVDRWKNSVPCRFFEMKNPKENNDDE